MFQTISNIGFKNLIRRIFFALRSQKWTKKLKDDFPGSAKRKVENLDDEVGFYFHNTYIFITLSDFLKSSLDCNYLLSLLSERYSGKFNISQHNAHDKKIFWELNRLYFLQDTLSEFRFEQKLDLLSAWLRAQNNNISVYFDCGHEVSIRCIHILNFYISHNLEYDELVIAYFKLAEDFISDRLYYSVSQQNNHTITETYTLCVLNAILNMNFKEEYVQKFKESLRLILDDGGTSQYSYNYALIVLRLLMFHKAYFELDSDAELLIDNKINVMRGFITNPALRNVSGFGQTDGSAFLKDFDNKIFSGDLEQVMKVRSSVFDETGVVATQTPCYSLVQRFPNYTYKVSHADYLHTLLTWRGDKIFSDRGVNSYIDAHYDTPLDHNMPVLQHSFNRKLTNFVFSVTPNGGLDYESEDKYSVFLHEKFGRVHFRRNLHVFDESVRICDEWRQNSSGRHEINFYTEGGVQQSKNTLHLQFLNKIYSIIFQQDVIFKIEPSTSSPRYLGSEIQITKVNVKLIEGQKLNYEIERI